MLHHRWLSPKHNPERVNKLKAKMHSKMPDFILQMLINRGFDTPQKIERLLNPELERLGNPYKMHDMKQGIQLIKKTIADKQKITIYGDYDTDGITSVSIMYLLLKHFHAKVEYFIPNRFKDGYGPNLAEYKRIIKNGTKLLITTDNGISGMKEITYARKHGMNVIITDHHDFPSVTKHGKTHYMLPPANDIIMAQFPSHKYNHGHEDFCGAGIAFKIAQAMLHRIPTELLDIVTLGTIADSVSLTSEDRILVANGLLHIHHDNRPGILALAIWALAKRNDSKAMKIKEARDGLAKLSSTDLSFSLIPRLNALGRMGDANIGVELLTTNDFKKAMKIAKITEERNNRRKKIMHEEAKQALAQAALPQNLKKTTLVLADKRWFPGVVGIIASRVLEEYYKPTIVIGHLKADNAKGIDRGSGRSIPEFNLFNAMDPIRKTMTSFGGHPMACGLSIKPAKIKALRNGLEKAGRKAHLDKVVPTIQPDLVVSPQDINWTTYHCLEKLEPFGQDNQQPLIAVKTPYLYNIAQMGKDSSHLSATLGESYYSTKVVSWDNGKLYDPLSKDCRNLELVGYMQVNHFRGRTYLQFQAKYFRHYRLPDFPSRYELAVIYHYLDMHAPLKFPVAELKSSVIIPLAAFLNIGKLQVRTALKIFKQLGLIKIGKGVLHLMPVVKCDLNDSAIYRQGIRREEL